MNIRARCLAGDHISTARSTGDREKQAYQPDWANTKTKPGFYLSCFVVCWKPNPLSSKVKAKSIRTQP